MAVRTERLAACRTKKGISKAALAREVGLSKSLFTLAEKKDEHEFKFTEGIKLCKALNVSAEYLLGLIEKETPYIYADQPTNNDDIIAVCDYHDKIISKVDSDKFSLLNENSAGDNKTYVVDHIYPKNKTSFEYINLLPNCGHVAVRADKRLLNGRVRCGDVMLIDEVKQFEPGDDVIIKNEGNTFDVGTVAWIRENGTAIDINDERFIINCEDKLKDISTLIAVIPPAGIAHLSVD